MPTIERRDIHASAFIPENLKEVILRVGGTNPYDEPMYRLLLAQDRVTQAAGEWTIWADNLSADERGGLGLPVIQKQLAEFREVVEVAIQRGLPQIAIERIAQQLSAEIDDLMKQKLGEAPLRVETGMVDVELYPFEGWILEKWKPAESFGSVADWEGYRFQGENALGPYPYSGEYELVAGPTPYLLTEAEIEDAIRQDFRIIQSRPRTARERVALLMSKVEQQRKEKARDHANKVEDFRKDGPASLHNRLSLGADRVIKDLMKQAGLEHSY